MVLVDAGVQDVILVTAPDDVVVVGPASLTVAVIVVSDTVVVEVVDRLMLQTHSLRTDVTESEDR